MFTRGAHFRNFIVGASKKKQNLKHMTYVQQ